MNNLTTAKRQAVALGLCGEYRRLWDIAKDKDELMMIATDPNGADFLADMVAFGWGLDVSYMRSSFRDFLGDKMQIQHNDYSSRIFISEPHLQYTTDSTLSIVLDCGGTVLIPKYSVSNLVIATNKPLRVVCDGRCDIRLFGDGSSVSIIGDVDNLNHIRSSQWVKGRSV